MSAHGQSVKSRILASPAGARILALLVLLAPAVAIAEPTAPGIDRMSHAAPSAAPFLGPRLAPVTIELYLALSDGGRSARAHYLATALREKHPMRIRVIYHLVGRSGGSDGFAEAAREAFAQGRFAPFITEFYRNGHTPPWREVADIARRAGLDTERFARAMKDRRHRDDVRAADYLRRRRGVLRIPGIAVNGVPVWPIQSMEDLETALDRASRRARAALSRGVKLADLFDRLVALRRADAPPPIVSRGRVEGMTPKTEDEPRPPVWVGARLAAMRHPSRGPASARVPVVLVCTFTSRLCAQMYHHIEDLRRAYPDEVRVVFRHAPAAADKENRRIHLAALCATRQGVFWDLYDRVFRHFRTRPRTEDDLRRLARSIPANVEALLACARSSGAASALDREVGEVEAAGARLAPSVAIGGVLYSGTKSFAELRALTEAALAPGFLGRLALWPPAE